jgi:hypothetical protein
MSLAIEIAAPGVWEHSAYAFHKNVVGHALVLVKKTDDGGLDVDRVIGVNADNAEDNQIVGDFIKKVEAKLAEIFEPEPVPEPSKLWVPS